jgi:tetratricopeptide (TPR) repeat protein
MTLHSRPQRKPGRPVSERALDAGRGALALAIGGRIPVLAAVALVIGMGATPGGLLAQELDIPGAYYRSYEYERTEDYPNAVRALAPVHQAYPQGYTVNLRMGWLFYLNRNYANALEHYETAMRVAPYALEAKLGYLLPLLAQERFADAETFAYQVVSVDYYNYYGNLRLAFALRMQGKLEQAEMVVSKMLTAYPTDVLYLTELALIKAAEGDTDAARSHFSDVLILDPENVTAKAYLGVG